jgi:electron transfer flavoprotein beta subunit
VRILAPLKLVPDPDNANRIRVSGDNLRLDTNSMEQKANPFDEYALEAALRLTEDGRTPRVRQGETILVSLGPSETEVMLRAGLATGADRAFRVATSDDDLDADRVAHVLSRLALKESCDLVLMGKQSVDGDSNEVGQRTAAILGWPQATFASRIIEQAENRLEVEREVDGGIQRVLLTLPAVITVDLRIVAPDAVRSKLTPEGFQYPPGVRFAPLPAIMQARRKALSIIELDSFGSLPKRSLRYIRYELPTSKAGGRVVSTPSELVRLLANEAKVL